MLIEAQRTVQAPRGIATPFPMNFIAVSDEVSESETVQEERRQFICSIANFSVSPYL